MIKTKLISSLDKVFPEDSLSDYSELREISMLKGERISFQLAYTYETDEEGRSFAPYVLRVTGDLAYYATVREVKCVGVSKPCGVYHDDNYLRSTPGAYPDLLYPLPESGRFSTSINLLSALWIDIRIPEDYAGECGKRSIILEAIRGNTVVGKELSVEIINAALPKQKLRVTQWLSHGSLSDYYSVKPWSAEHLRIERAFLERGAENGMNMIMLPTFSGLFRIEKHGESFSFNFRGLGKYIDMCLEIGYEYFEVPHLFTAGSAAYAERIPYYENGELKNTRGMKADDPEYVALIRAFIKALRKYMKRRGLDGKCYFHIADEPALKNMELFRAAKDSVADLLEGAHVIDALFDIEYYKEGLVTTPVPITDHIEPFLDYGVENLWTYYCTGPQRRCSNRFIAQSGACTRSIGMQLYKFKIQGFLHWALCYYYSGDTGGLVNPYVEHSGKSWVPAGDTFLIYPGPGGEPHDSLRHIIFGDAMQDIRAMELCETLYSHDEVVRAIEEELGCELRFSVCAKSTEVMGAIRERINQMIKARL